jgi:hypothetical protein
MTLEERPLEDSSVVYLRIEIVEGRNLPRIKSRLNHSKLPPNSYVTLPNVGSNPKLPVSTVIEESCCPEWSFVHDLQV